MTGPPDNPLDWSKPGGPRSRRFGDVYYSLQDGLAESRAVFLAGCGLPDAWAGRSRFTVAELGFGTGLNIAALLHLWRSSGARGRLHVFSVEGFPVLRQDAERALSAWPEISEAASALLERWPAATPGFHRIDLPGWNVVLDLAVGDAAWALEQWGGRADAWFLDGFSPALNPDMWSDAVLDAVAARSAPGARLGTFTVAGAVRRGLAARGFVVDKRPGHGRKRERLEAVLPGPTPETASPRVAVIGAGIAGAALARALKAVGLSTVVIEADQPGAGASGFPAALVTPRLDVGDADLAVLFARMLDRAGDLYRDIPGAVTAEGVLRLEHGPRDGARFDKVRAQDVWPPGAMTRLAATDVADRLGEPVDAAALMMAQAMTIRPSVILEAWLADAPMIAGRAASLETTGAGRRVLDAEGAVLAEADAVVLAAGWGTAALTGASGILGAVRGQASWVRVDDRPEMGVSWGGYLAPMAGGLLFGATHDRDDAGDEIRLGDDARNLATLRAILPGLARRIEGAPVTSRAAVRATTRDRLPVAGILDAGLFVLGGLGSRGFVAAPLLAEHVAALIADSPSPLPRALAQRVDPSRPALKARP